MSDYKFSGKIILGNIDNSNQIIELDKTDGSIETDNSHSTISQERRFNFYTDKNGNTYIQAVNGKYVVYDSQTGYIAKSASREDATIFNIKDGVKKDGSGKSKGSKYITHNVSATETGYWDIDNDNLICTIKKNGDSTVGITEFEIKILTPGLDVILSNGAIEKDLTYADLSGENFSNLMFSNSILNNADFSECIFVDSSISGVKTVAHSTSFISCNMHNATLIEGDFSGSDFRKSVLSNVNASKAKFSNGRFDMADLSRFTGPDTKMDNAVLTASNCPWATFQNADFSNADLSGANLENAAFNNNKFDGARFDNAKIPNVIFALCTVNENTSFKGAIANNCNFSNLNLSNVSFSHAVLTNSIFSGANMSNCDLSYAELSGAKFLGTNSSDSTNLVGATLANVTMVGADFTKAQLGVKENKLLAKYKIKKRCSKKTLLEVKKDLQSAADLTGAYMPNTVFDNANLFGVNMTGVNWYGDKASANNADLQMINFTNANLGTMNFSQARLNGCTFDYANLISANFRKANLNTASLLNKRVSFSYANIQGADFFDSSISDAVFTNSAVAINDGPYFAIPVKGIENEPTLNQIIALLNKNGSVPDTIINEFVKAGYTLEPDATVEVFYTSCYWYVNNGKNEKYPKYTLYLANDVIKVGGTTIGVSLFIIKNILKEDVNALNSGKLPKSVMDGFANNGFTLIDKAAINKTRTIENKKWYIDNNTHDSTKLQKGYVEFTVLSQEVKSSPTENDVVYNLNVYGYTLATVKVNDDNTFTQEINFLSTTKIIQNLLKGETICPNGQKISTLTDERENLRITWEEAMKANILPKEPKCIPDPFHWCP